MKASIITNISMAKGLKALIQAFKGVVLGSNPSGLAKKKL